MLCTHKTTIFCQFGNFEICPNFANRYLTQFSSISGGNCITSSVHPSPSGSDCDDNSVIPVSLDAVVDIVNDIVAAGPTVCSTSHAEKKFIAKNHYMAVVMAMAEHAVYKVKPILVKAHEDTIINAKKKEIVC